MIPASSLAYRRRALGLSQAEVAKRVGVNESTVSRWESGEQMPSFANAVGWAHAVRYPFSELLDSATSSREWGGYVAADYQRKQAGGTATIRDWNFADTRVSVDSYRKRQTA